MLAKQAAGRNLKKNILSFSGIDNVRQNIANMQSSLSPQTTSRAQGQGMQLQMELIRPGRSLSCSAVQYDSDQARYTTSPMSFSSHRNSISVVQSEFKLQWPKTVVGGISMNARLSSEVVQVGGVPSHKRPITLKRRGFCTSLSHRTELRGHHKN
jgi:hypothetical protein